MTFIINFGLLTKKVLNIDLFSSFIYFLLKPSNIKDALVEIPLKIKERKPSQERFVKLHELDVKSIMIFFVFK